MRKPGRLSIICGAVLLAAVLLPGTSAQDLPESYAQVILSGRASAVSKEALGVNGLHVRLNNDTIFKGVNERGRIVDLKASDFAPGLLVTVFLESQGSSPVALAVYRGEAFSMRGTVSDLLTGRKGYVDFITLDGSFKVDVRDAVSDGDGDDDSARGKEANYDTVDLGDEIVLQGIAVGGILHAVFARVSARPDEDGAVGESDQAPVEVSRHSRESSSASRVLAKACRGLKPRRGRAAASGSRGNNSARVVRRRKSATIRLNTTRQSDHLLP